VARHRGKNIDRIREYDRKRGYREYDTKKAAARRAVNHAVASGKLSSKPRFCGEEKTEAHHHDYDKALDMTWICKKHHAELHRGD
jgi:hypothetical protein